MPKKGAAKKAARKASKGKKTTRTTAVVTATKDDTKLLDEVGAANAVTGGMWRGEVVGDTIVGEILSMKREDGQYADDQLQIILGTEDGAKTLYCNFSLESGLVNTRCAIGDRIAVQFKGDVPVSRGRPMHTYAVVRAGGKGKKAEAILTSATSSRRVKGKKTKRSRR